MVSTTDDEKGMDVTSSHKQSKNRKRSRYDDDDRRPEVKHSKHSSKHEKKSSRHRKRQNDDDDDNDEKSSILSSSTESSDEYRRDKTSRHKKDRQDKKKKDKKRPKKGRRKQDNNDDNTEYIDPMERNHLLADALCNLFDQHPNFASELPVILIRLGRGATFNLSGMTDRDAAERLTSIFQCLSPFGVTLDDDLHVWSWKNPSISGNSFTCNDLVLIRVIRALLDQIGITMAAIDIYENPPPVVDDRKITSKRSSLDRKNYSDALEVSENEVEQKVRKMLQTFRSSNFAEEVAGVCTMILEGEMVNLDGVPDDAVRESLESILSACGLQKSEMEVDDDDDDANDNGPPLGFGLPESEVEHAKTMLSSAITVCQSNTKVPARRSVKGPMLPGEYNNGSSSDDDDGPLPAGAAATRRDNTISKEQLKSLAARRAYELACAKEGIEIDPASMNGGVREEWMIVPGKYDFLGSIQTGRSRTFAGKTKLDANSKQDAAIDPKIQAEIRAIREAYEETRGPSLMDQHREAKKLEQQQKQQQQQTGANTWKWNRDKDLDDGRRVDTDALGMILGGAGTNLKNRFQSGV